MKNKKIIKWFTLRKLQGVQIMNSLLNEKEAYFKGIEFF